MSWSYFTANLAEGDFFTEDQRNELYDAFLERAGAVARWLSDTYEASTDLRDSLVATDLIERDGDTPIRLAVALSDLSQYYVRPAKVEGYPDADESDVFVFNGSTTENLLYMAATDLGYATDLFADEHLHSWKKWNVIRAAIQLLKYPLIATAGDGLQAPTRYGKSASDYPWADANAAFIAASESSPGGAAPTDLYLLTTDGSPTFIEIEGKRATYELEIPATGPFADYQLIGWFNRIGGTGVVNHPITLEFDGGEANVATLPVGPDLVCADASDASRSATGAVDLAAYLDGYFDGAALDDLEPPTEDVVETGADVFQIAAIPTFTHP